MTFRPVITTGGNETAAILHLLQIERTGKSRKLTAADLIPLGIGDSSEKANQSTWKKSKEELNDKDFTMKYCEKLHGKRLRNIEDVLAILTE